MMAADGGGFDMDHRPPPHERSIDAYQMLTGADVVARLGELVTEAQLVSTKRASEWFTKYCSHSDQRNAMIAQGTRELDQYFRALYLQTKHGILRSILRDGWLSRPKSIAGIRKRCRKALSLHVIAQVKVHAERVTRLHDEAKKRFPRIRANDDALNNLLRGSPYWAVCQTLLRAAQESPTENFAVSLSLLSFVDCLATVLATSTPEPVMPQMEPAA